MQQWGDVLVRVMHFGLMEGVHLMMHATATGRPQGMFKTLTKPLTDTKVCKCTRFNITVFSGVAREKQR